MAGDAQVLRGPQELTADWLRRALGTGPIEGFTVEEIGTGQMSESRRVRIGYGSGEADGPASVVLKTASEDEASRATGMGLGIYEREVRFYRELAPRIGGPLARCHAALIDPREGWFTLVLEDVAPAVQGDQIAGCSVEQARIALRELAHLHAPVFGDVQLGATPWLNQETPLTQAVIGQLLPPFLERYGDRIEDAHRQAAERFVASLDGWYLDRRPPLGLVHGDYRLDNMLFGTGEVGRRFVAVDWQTVSWGPAMTDASYFLGGSLSVEDRRAHEDGLLREYFDALHALGVRDFAWEHCWSAYRRQSFLGILMTVAPAMLVERTERGDEMFATTFQRYAQQVIDLEAVELLPASGAARVPALRPLQGDERRHPPGAEQLWNESWYFDAISEDCRLGLYTRLGLYPNLGLSWLTAFICGPDRDAVAIVDFAAPLPAGEELTVRTPGAEFEHECLQPLQRFRVRAQADAESFADPSAILRGAKGEPVRASFEVQWDTLGEPYAYRAATRYEIPCSVSGTLRVGDQSLELEGVGQRDHSWGPRDWWSAEWVWSAGHLQDGTRLHGVELRLPGQPPIGVGYEQPPGGGVVELDRVSASEEIAHDGLIAKARIGYGELGVAVEPVAFGPLLLQAPDGRVSQFPRAMCRLLSDDGRRGVAWVEWNRNASLGPSAPDAAS